ncbi:MAG TPA: 1,4-dihydroxy-6-naphthoate synthase [Chitinophagaceae bacterium]|jgi:1,4-dihydroxy-6-naphthoate synthase|nr:1,4-dihydroxy-6-naphthoate synthase [Chitinophagaceae bacterium]
MNITLGFSPCPNDTFIFDALVNGQIDTEGLRFEAVLEDVETLNRWAAEGRLQVTKLSFPALFANSGRYGILSSGSALGKGVGPLLIAREPMDPAEVPFRKVALPGQHTTAHFLFQYAFPEARNKEFRLFSEIEGAVLDGTADAGVIIHENRFTYVARGLHKVRDLGTYWEEQTGLPIPLGCIAARRDLEPGLALRINNLIRRSLEWSFARYPELAPFVRAHAQEMEEAVMRQHIELYVNRFSLDLGPEGRRAIAELYRQFAGPGEESGLFL